MHTKAFSEACWSGSSCYLNIIGMAGLDPTSSYHMGAMAPFRAKGLRPSPEGCWSEAGAMAG